MISALELLFETSIDPRLKFVFFEDLENDGLVLRLMRAVDPKTYSNEAIHDKLLLLLAQLLIKEEFG